MAAWLFFISLLCSVCCRNSAHRAADWLCLYKLVARMWSWSKGVLMSPLREIADIILVNYYYYYGCGCTLGQGLGICNVSVSFRNLSDSFRTKCPTSPVSDSCIILFWSWRKCPRSQSRMYRSRSCVGQNAQCFGLVSDKTPSVSVSDLFI